MAFSTIFPLKVIGDIYMKKIQFGLIWSLMVTASLFGSSEPEEMIGAYLTETGDDLKEYSFTLYKEGESSLRAGEGLRLNQGSLSKIFTTLLMVRLDKTGMLSLHDKVGDYLSDSSYAPFYDVTIKSILRHDSGIAQRGFATAERYGTLLSGSDPEKDLFKLADKEKITIYSSMAFVLLENIIVAIYDQPYEEVLERELLSPLELYETGFGFDSTLLTGFDHSGSRYPTYRTRIPASGNIISSGRDMGRLLQFLLSGKSGFLERSDLQKLFELQDNASKNYYGRGIGFSVRSVGPYRAVYHDGGAPGTNSRLFLLPDLGLGFHFSYNNNSYRFKNDLTDLFLQGLTGSGFKETYYENDLHTLDSQVRNGYYIPLDNSFTTLEKINTLVGQVRVSGSGDDLMIGGKTLDQYNVPLSIKSTDDIIYLSIGNSTFKKADLLESFPVRLALLGTAFIAIIAATLLTASKWKKSGLALFLLIMLLYFYQLLSMDFWIIAYGMPLRFALFSITLLALGLAIPFLPSGGRKRTFRSRIAKVTGFSTLLVLFWLHSYNLLIPIQ